MIIHSHLGYAWIPFLSALVWLGGIIGMLAVWSVEGHPKYLPREGNIVYISDIGAHLKPLFISTYLSLPHNFKALNIDICLAINSITGTGFVWSQAVERYLRHQGRLAPDHLKMEKLMSALSILFSIIGGVALILLSIFDVIPVWERKLIKDLSSCHSSLVTCSCFHRLHRSQYYCTNGRIQLA